MTLQEIFSTVVRHLHTQGARSVSAPSPGSPLAGVVCRYRADNQLSCAVGVLIPDRYYSGAMEGHTPADTPVQLALVKTGVLGDDESNELRRDKVRLLTELQTIHDAFYALPNWPWAATVTKLAERGNHFHLTWPEDVPHA